MPAPESGVGVGVLEWRQRGTAHCGDLQAVWVAGLKLVGGKGARSWTDHEGLEQPC